MLAALMLAGVAHAASANFWIDIANDRLEQVKTQLALGEDPNAVNGKGQPALMQAIRDGAWKTYDLLVAHRKINVNATNASDETPLMYLAIVGDIDRAKALIKKGAEVNRLGWTPLHYAASKGNVDMTRMLLANKAMVNAPSPDGTSPLMMAAYAGSESTVRLLLQKGADVTARNLQKQDAADWARLKDHTALADQLDALTRKVLAERERKRARSGSGAEAVVLPGRGGSGQGGAGPAGFGVTTVETPDPVPPAVLAAPKADKPAQSDTQEGNSTSKYFDLERFERDESW